MREVIEERTEARNSERPTFRCLVLNLHFEFTVNEITEDVLLLILRYSDGINDANKRTVAEMHRDETEERERAKEKGRERTRQGKRKAGSTAMN